MLPQLREIQFECPQKSWLAEIVTLCINFEEVLFDGLKLTTGP